MSADDCQKIPQIVQGERKELTVTLVNEETKQAIDLSGATEIQSVHPKDESANGGFLIKKLEKIGIAEITDISTVADSSDKIGMSGVKSSRPALMTSLAARSAAVSGLRSSLRVISIVSGAS